ncbi:Fe-S cluster assembly protein SufD [Pseudochrobactrum sp. sp1633]|uniref:Fe-S cluster assembly protein SufD n=1 Tax=Pseudochrobactrum sp. sp1633 TaxID=3036706 RepID=UPI0025A52B90|nr:Fe-S cluster assembly protein SufD [Pseudochrobactrum sp. sp1633]MDM8344025.1 Fe-S cluster assembly protein SufD [Pseudochrobactrum sp. sp1633]HWD11999.1 Fe-S cluster assembly protein SufD [Pseudochrobactrum sp.]
MNVISPKLATKVRTPAESALIDAFVSRVGDLPGDAEVLSARDNALEALKINGLPGRRIESWHYTDMRTLLRSVAPFDASVEHKSVAPLLDQSAVLSVANGVAQKPAKIEGVRVEAIREILGQGIAAHTLQIRGDDDTIGQINAAYASDGWGVSIADGTDLEQAIELQNLQPSGQSHVRFPVKIGSDVKATIIERQIGGEGETFATSVSHVSIADNSEIVWVIVREHTDLSTQLSQINVTIGENSKLVLFVMNAGGKLVRQEVHVDVKGEGSDFQLRGLNLLGGETVTDVTMTVGHLVENTTSTEVIRNVVTDKARGIFQGMIRVAQIAQKTDAKMSCNTLLLSDDAEFSAKPELEIFADDVACGHGATVREIEKDHLFYLMARGVPENAARGLLVKAFIAEVIEELENEVLVEKLEDILQSWLEKHA